MARLAELHRAHLFLEHDHRAVFHPLLQRARVSPPALVRPFNGDTAEKGHLRVLSVLTAAREKAFAEKPAEVVFQQCGEILRHGGFVPQPLILADIFSVLVRHYAAARGKRGLWQGEKPVRGFGHGSRRVGLFLGDLQKHLLTQRECRLVRVLLKYE